MWDIIGNLFQSNQSIDKPLTELTKLDVPFIWTEQCQKSFELLKEYLFKEPILVYPDTRKPYTLYTDANNYTWTEVLTQRYVHEIEGKDKEVYHPVTYLSGLFRGRQLNWATLTKEAYAIYMSYFTYACKTKGKNGISRLISEMA